ncbi:4-hydroxybenzoate octaprenyltransferase [Thalassospiraceae bacterium LMO-SO8]|nr:4-hydroxybenzoate octaprenyltransferase [Alphaproteobacteria bacterium LMO-S08]WND77918.1 4-hydroxybenzoate octaprenyltransferase [Thalassospiraceae bacterium LMO-SO8]
MDERQQVSASDIPLQSWIDRVPGAGVRPYLRLARLDRPIGTWLLLLPCWWATAMASPGWPDPWFMALFAVGALVMRGAGCTINDIADRDIDKKVARTADRPITSGQVSVVQALAFLALQLGIGLAVLLQFNTYTVILGASSLALVALYPFAKRVTYWPQFVLGLTFNWGALVGWAAVTGGLEAPAVLLYAAGLLWTMGYDTIYAHQDKEDDVLVGVKSTALKFGDATGPWLAAFYGGTITLLAAAGIHAALHPVYFAGLAVAALHLTWQVRSLDLDDAKICLARFKSNRDFGLIVLAAIIAGRLLAPAG